MTVAIRSSQRAGSRTTCGVAALAFFGYVLFLAGCPQELEEVEIYLASDLEHLPNPAFELYDPKNPEHPRCSMFKVSEDNPASETTWHIHANSTDAQAWIRIAYGELPWGYTQFQPTIPLMPGKRYQAACHGGNTEGLMRFRVLSDGRVVEQGGR